MYHEQLSQLFSYLLDASPTPEELCGFLFLETFSHLSPNALLISESQDFGRVHMLAGFGAISPDYKSVAPFPFATENPFNAPVRNRTTVSGPLAGLRENSGIDLEKLQARSAALSPQEPWVHFAAGPIGRSGGMVLFFTQSVDLSEENQSLISSVTNIIALHLKRAHKNLPAKGEQGDGSGISSILATFSKRQRAIFELVRESKTNLEISRSIGYSESLVRQELVKIFRGLGVKTRGELRSLPLDIEDFEEQESSRNSKQK